MAETRLRLETRGRDRRVGERRAGVSSVGADVEWGAEDAPYAFGLRPTV